MKERKQKEYKPRPAYSGEIKCDNGHVRIVKDLNVERVAVWCAQCGDYFSVKELK